jgi:hypothetical protein
MAKSLTSAEADALSRVTELIKSVGGPRVTELSADPTTAGLAGGHLMLFDVDGEQVSLHIWITD